MTKQYELRQTMSTAHMPAPTYDYVAHPLANMFPMIEGQEFENLKASIAKSGILEPIRLFQGLILDGRNRYTAGKACGHQFTAKDFKDWNRHNRRGRGMGPRNQPSPSPPHSKAETRDGARTDQKVSGYVQSPDRQTNRRLTYDGG